MFLFLRCGENGFDKGSERGPKALNEPNVLINLSSLFLEKGFATHDQKILEFLFYFVHPFLYLPFFKKWREMFLEISLLCFYKNVFATHQLFYFRFFIFI
jgi:hypothetical protein